MICADIVFVGRSESYRALRIELKSFSCNHLQVQLFSSARASRQIEIGTNLIIIIEFLEVTLRDEISHDLISQSNPVVKIS